AALAEALQPREQTLEVEQREQVVVDLLLLLHGGERRELLHEAAVVDRVERRLLPHLGDEQREERVVRELGGPAGQDAVAGVAGGFSRRDGGGHVRSHTQESRPCAGYATGRAPTGARR